MTRSLRVRAGRQRARRERLIRQRSQPPVRPGAIDDALRQHGAEPRAEGAPPVIVDQQGAPHAFAVLKTEEVAVESVRQLSCATAGIEGVGRTVEPRAMLPDEVFPGAFVTVSA